MIIQLDTNEIAQVEQMNKTNVMNNFFNNYGIYYSETCSTATNKQ